MGSFVHCCSKVSATGSCLGAPQSSEEFFVCCKWPCRHMYVWCEHLALTQGCSSASKPAQEVLSRVCVLRPFAPSTNPTSTRNRIFPWWHLLLRPRLISPHQQAYSGWISAPKARCWSRRGLLVLDASGEHLALFDVITGGRLACPSCNFSPGEPMMRDGVDNPKTRELCARNIR